MIIDSIYTEQDFLIFYSLACQKNGIKKIEKDELEKNIYNILNKPKYKNLFKGFIFGLNVNKTDEKVDLFNAFNYATVYDYLKESKDKKTYIININEDAVNSVACEYSQEIIDLINELQDGLKPSCKLKYTDSFLNREIYKSCELKKQ